MPESSAPAAITPDQLLGRARDCLTHAYAPYSRFPVAAAVLDEHGRVFTGVNVENASYGLTICAERAAIFAAIAAGAKRITALAVTALHRHPVTPCGACRQVLAEFGAPELAVYSDAPSGTVNWTLGHLLPDAFSGDLLKASEHPHDLVAKM